MKRKRTHTDSVTSESDVDNSENTTSESDGDNLDNTDNETETDSASESANSDDTSSEVDGGYENDPWAALKAEATKQNKAEFEELTQNFTAEGIDEDEAKGKAYILILPKLRKDLQNIYLERLLWIRQLKRDPVHKKIMETRDAFVSDDNFDHDEALEAAIDKRKFLLKRLFSDTRSPNMGESSDNDS